MSVVDWLQWLLLPVIALLAFWLAQWFFRARVDRLQNDRDARLRRTLKAMQQLLDEKPEEALRSVLGLVAGERAVRPAGFGDDAVDLNWLAVANREAVDRETLDMHFIVGRLLRRQGDFERAIRVHQAMTETASLDDQTRSTALLELGRDFLAAGVYDRAEIVLRSVIADERRGIEASRLLLSILEMQREWAEADVVAEDLAQRISLESNQFPQEERASESSTDWLTHLRAHYALERALEHLQSGDLHVAREHTERAAHIAPGLPRADLMRADCSARSGDLQAAIAHTKRAVQTQPSLVALGIARIESFARELSAPLSQQQNAENSDAGEALVIEVLRDIQRLHPSAFGAIALTRALRRAGRLDEALASLREVLAMRPVPVSGLLEAVRWMKVLPSSQPYFSDFESFERALADQLSRRALFQCTHCGFEGRQHVWHCPSCRRWDSFRALDIDPDALEVRISADPEPPGADSGLERPLRSLDS